MKLTKSRLQQIIKEETKKVVGEGVMRDVGDLFTTGRYGDKRKAKEEEEDRENWLQAVARRQASADDEPQEQPSDESVEWISGDSGRLASMMRDVDFPQDKIVVAQRAFSNLKRDRYNTSARIEIALARQHGGVYVIKAKAPDGKVYTWDQSSREFV